MYKVIYKFADKLDENHVYEIGDIYPREGVDVTDERIEELASNKNAISKPVIEEVMSEPVEEETESKFKTDEKPKKRK